jgi:hypothetical protein
MRVLGDSGREVNSTSRAVSRVSPKRGPDASPACRGPRRALAPARPKIGRLIITCEARARETKLRPSRSYGRLKEAHRGRAERRGPTSVRKLSCRRDVGQTSQLLAAGTAKAATTIRIRGGQRPFDMAQASRQRQASPCNRRIAISIVRSTLTREKVCH